MNEEKKKQVLALGQLGWSLRQIEKATGIRRETARGYLKAAGIGLRPRGDDLDVRSEIQKIALEFPCYGRPRIKKELKRRGWTVNQKRVARVMREDNLLCLRRKKFVTTTEARHGLPVYPNPARDMRLTRINELWIADITYIRLETEFVYLAVVLDAYSRRVIGWALDRTLEHDLAIAALQMAFDQRKPKQGLTHHSDRGVQYASHDYTGLLKDHSVTISMSRKGNPYDNAFCESFMKTLKHEEVHRQEYRGLADARASIGRFIEKVYNGKRPHSALDYRPPIEFELSLPVVSTSNCSAGACMKKKSPRKQKMRAPSLSVLSGMAESIGPMCCYLL